jgi:hypothetical protein
MDWHQQADAALNRLTKWRTVLAGWQLGTRAKGDSEADAVRDTRELLLLLRVEVTALYALGLRAGAFTHDEWLQQVTKEAHMLEMAMEQRFPGFKATDEGIEVETATAVVTTKDWRK